MVIIGQKTLREELGIDVMAQLKASVLKEQGRHDGAGMELTVRSVGEPNDGAVLRAAMAVTAFVPGVAPGDVERDVDNEVTLTLLPSQRPMLFQGSQVEMRDRVGVLETTVDNSVDHDSPPGCAKMLRDIVFARTLTYCVVRCRATHLHARSLWRSGFIQVQRWCARIPHLGVIACRGVRESLAPTAARW